MSLYTACSSNDQTANVYQLVKFCLFILKILSETYEILTSIKGHNSVKNVQKKDAITILT